MLKIFRKIRQQLLNSGQMKKYSLYAIGEILLVVIGILIALQINNWNEDRKDRNTEKSILQEMKNNLHTDLNDIRFNLRYDSTNSSATKIVLNHLENKLPFHDSLEVYFGRMGDNTLLLENTSAYENLKSLGFNLISNKELKLKITNLYSARYEYLDEISKVYTTFIFSNYQPALLEHTTSYTNDFKRRFPNNFQELMNNNSFKEVIRHDLFFKKISISLSKKTEKKILELMELIDKELSL